MKSSVTICSFELGLGSTITYSLHQEVDEISSEPASEASSALIPFSPEGKVPESG